MGKKQITFEDMERIARIRKGKCVGKMHNIYDPLKWKCIHGHTWQMSPAHIYEGKWCPVCQKTFGITIEDMQKIAEMRGGKCLSEKYVNLRGNLRWQCCNGHQWEASPYIIRKGSWCQSCSGSIGKGSASRDGEVIKQLQEKINDSGIKSLKREIDNIYEKIEWQCESGHIWARSVQQMRRLHKCPVCNRKILREQNTKLRNARKLEKIKKFVEFRGDSCLSEKYVSIQHKMKFVCNKNHEYFATPLAIRKLSFRCPVCVKERLIS